MAKNKNVDIHINVSKYMRHIKNLHSYKLKSFF